MMAVPFDTLKFADRLQASGFTQEQAHGFAAALAEVAAGSEAVTRQDINGLATRADVQAGLAETKAEILKWMVGAIGIQTVVIISAVIALVRTAH